MASIERTAYPRFGRVVPTRELHDVYTPDLAEVDWARGVSRSDVHLLALVVLLKCFQRLGYFPKVEEIPAVIIQRVRGCLELPADIFRCPLNRGKSTSAPRTTPAGRCVTTRR